MAAKTEIPERPRLRTRFETEVKAKLQEELAEYLIGKRTRKERNPSEVHGHSFRARHANQVDELAAHYLAVHTWLGYAKLPRNFARLIRRHIDRLSIASHCCR